MTDGIAGPQSRIPSPDSRIPSLCAIVDAEAAADAGWTVPDLAAAYLAGGARFLQVRAKRASGGWLLETAVRVIRLARRSEAMVTVNDRADIARIAEADGVHIGQDDVSVAGARVLLGDAAMVGLSTHTPEQIDAALVQPISYLAIGPVFGSSTKATGYDAIGLARVGYAADRSHGRRLPVVAIGGITLDSVVEVIEAGASSVAIIGDLLRTSNPEARVRAYLERLAGLGKV